MTDLSTASEPRFSEDELLPLSALSDLVFCERRAALHLLEQMWSDNVATTEGTLLHKRVHKAPGTEVRGTVRIARGLLLHSMRLGVSGKADVVEFHRVEKQERVQTGHQGTRLDLKLQGVTGLWVPYPVEYKRGRLRRNRSFEIQLCAQAICLEEMLGVPVSKGAIFFGKTARRQETMIDARLRAETQRAAARLHEVVRSGITPKATREKKCAKCSLLDACMPAIISRKQTVRSYLQDMIKESEEGLL